MMGKKAFIHTFGCQMNEYDSSRILSLLKMAGFERAEVIDEADCIIVNTCSVRDKAEQKVYSLLGRLKKQKEKRGAIIALGGCVAQQIGKSVFDRVPHVDIVFGTHNIDMLPEMIRHVEEGAERVSEVSMYDVPFSFGTPLSLEKGEVKAYVTIMQGCDNFCSYCIVPFVRGREYSRPPEEVLAEVTSLARQGVKEVTLLGQNVNSYGNKEGKNSFPSLLSRIEEIEGIERIRFVTSHPKDFSQYLIETIARLEKVCPHIHLPAQSGSNRILSAMGRGYSKEHYISIINMIRERVPDVSFSSDFIVGFPGEEEGDFLETLDLIEEVRFDSSFSFIYSPRPGTAAAEMAGQVEREEKRSRLMELQLLQRRITEENYRKHEGVVEKVLVEGFSKTDDNKYTGRTKCNIVVNFRGGSARKGDVVPVLVESVFVNSLYGRMIEGGRS